MEEYTLAFILSNTDTVFDVVFLITMLLVIIDGILLTKRIEMLRHRLGSMCNQTAFTIDNLTLSDARLLALSESEDRAGGVGTLSEKMLHRILKYCIDRNPANHEIEVLGSIADVKNEQGIFEIQTRSFDKLAPKLARFLPEHNVTVIYPIEAEKTLRYVDKADGSITEPKRSPRHLRIYDAAKELRHISSFIGHANLTVKLVFLRVEEYRLLDGRGPTKTRGATKLERLPVEIISEIDLKSKADYISLLPDELPETFSAAEHARLIKRRSRDAYSALRLLLDLGLLTRERVGRAYVYKRNNF